VGAVRVGKKGGAGSMLAIDRHAWTNRWRDRHPLEKLVPAGGMLLVALILPPWPTALFVGEILLKAPGARAWAETGARSSLTMA